MGNVGILRLSTAVLTTLDAVAYHQVLAFLQDGSHITLSSNNAYWTDTINYTLNHPDFTEPDGTEYILLLSLNQSTPWNRGPQYYISALQAYQVDNTLVTLKEYENPYA